MWRGNVDRGFWDEGEGDEDHLRKRKNAVMATAIAITRKREKAAKHLVAHFFSVLLIS